MNQSRIFHRKISCKKEKQSYSLETIVNNDLVNNNLLVINKIIITNVTFL